MEKGIALLDFENIDQMVQVHGTFSSLLFANCQMDLATVTSDYEGVGLTSRDANSKKAASTASQIFQDYYPELLVSCSS